MTDVVRGRDLFAATHVHRLLQALLGLPTPAYHHHPLLTDAGGRAPRQAARRADARRPCATAGMDPAALVAALRARRIAGWIFAGAGVERRAMKWLLVILIVLAAGATLFVLIKGVIGMAQRQGPHRPALAGS